MSEGRFDVAVVGSDPLSLLLAGLLVRDHGKRVIRFGGLPSPQRLARQVPMCLPLAARPQTWRIADAALAETRTIFSSIDASAALASADVLVVTERPVSRAGIGHMAHAGHGYGLRARPMPEGMRFLGVCVLRTQSFYDAYATSILAGAVTTPDTPDVRLSFDDSGAARLAVAGRTVDAARIVLVDEAAILDLLPAQQRPGALVAQSVTSTLTASTAALRAPIVHYFDRGVTHVQRDGGGILAIVEGDDALEARLGSSFAGPFPIRRLATSRHRRLVTPDGAPMIGLLKSGVAICAGLGSVAPFMGGLLARWVADALSETETSWLGGHDPAVSRDTVIDLSPQVFA